MTYVQNGYEVGGTAGQQASPSGGGRILNLLESGMSHPTASGNLVDKGMPIAYGNIVGVAMADAAANTDYIGTDTEGLWHLSVIGTDESGNSAVAIGDSLFLSSGAAATLTKNSSGTRFGTALGAVAAGATTVIVVKIHSGSDSGLAVETLSQSVAFGDFTDNGDATGYVDLTATLPAGALVLGWKCVVSTGFTGDTTAVVSVGIAGDLDRFSADTAQSVLAAATVGSLALAADAADGINAAVTVRVTVTGGADFGSISAGVMVVNVYYVRT